MPLAAAEGSLPPKVATNSLPPAAAEGGLVPEAATNGLPATRDWLALTADTLNVSAAYEHCVDDACGAVVLFSGTVRNHAGDRTGVHSIDYEAYESAVVPKLGEIAQQMHSRWPQLGPIAMLHRVGPVALGGPSVVVATSAPHRGAAFAAAQFGIDTLKASVPIWKREHHDAGSDWGLAATDIQPVDVAANAGHAPTPDQPTPATTQPSPAAEPELVTT